MSNTSDGREGWDLTFGHGNVPTPPVAPTHEEWLLARAAVTGELPLTTEPIPQARQRGILRKLWNKIDEPRIHRVMWLIRYAIITAAGLLVIFMTPRAIIQELGTWGTAVLALTLTAGGVIGALFVLRHKWFWERIAIWLAGAGVAIYFVNTVSLHFSSEGNRLFQACFLAWALISLIDRHIEIVRYEVEPGY